MRCRHRANASLKRIYETVDRSASPVGVGDECADGRESVFDAMVKFGIQDFAGLFGSLAFGDVDLHADHASCVAGLVIFYKTARLDPSDRSAGTHNTKLRMMLAALLGK